MTISMYLIRKRVVMMLDKNTLQWLEDRKRKNFFCRTYCGYAHDMGGEEICCMFPADECPHDYVDAKDNKEFEHRVKEYLREHDDVEDTPCAHGMRIFCPAKHMGAPFLGCAKWCMLREARLHVEREMENEGGKSNARK